MAGRLDRSLDAGASGQSSEHPYQIVIDAEEIERIRLAEMVLAKEVPT